MSLPSCWLHNVSRGLPQFSEQRGKLRQNGAKTILNEARLQHYISDVLLPLGWDDAKDGGPEIGLREG